MLELKMKLNEATRPNTKAKLVTEIKIEKNGKYLLRGNFTSKLYNLSNLKHAEVEGKFIAPKK